jgi:hypothetical protein
LALIELPSNSKIFKILVVGPDLYRVASSFKIMSPLFKPSDDSEHLSVMDLVILLYWVECFRQEGDWVPGIINMRLLGENCSSSDARAISFKSKWEIVKLGMDRQ